MAQPQQQKNKAILRTTAAQSLVHQQQYLKKKTPNTIKIPKTGTCKSLGEVGGGNRQ